MPRAVRKQLYLSREHDNLLKALAADWRTTEAAVVRRALDDLAESERNRQPDRRSEKEKLADELLRRAGILGGGWTSPRLSDRDLALMIDPPEVERALLQRRTELLGGGNDVIAEREERTRIIAGQPLDD
jgi:hypothetical protein